MQSNRLLNVGALILQPPKGIRVDDIRLPGGKVLNAHTWVFERDLPPGYFDESAVGAVTEAATEVWQKKHV